MTAAASDIFTSLDTRCRRHEDVLVLSFEQPRPQISSDVLESLERAVAEAERGGKPLVVASSGEHFAFGANLNDAFDATLAGRPDVLDAALTNYQRVMLRIRHALVPTVAAVRGVAISGGCELLMHCARVVAHEHSRIGLLEAGVGIVPGGGGLKEFARRAAKTADLAQAVIEAFETTAAFKMSSNAREAQRLGFLTPLDSVTNGDPLEAAIAVARTLLTTGSRPPQANPLFQVAGDHARRHIETLQSTLLEAGKLTEHQFEINRRVADVLCGGDAPGSQRSEAELLALERRHLIALVQTPLTQARLAHVRTTGKLLMN